MKRWLAFISVTLLLGMPGLRAEQAPHGELLELHSCQLYIGGCIASSEATQEGHCLLRVWSFTDGSCNGVSLDGLQVGLLEIGKQNLAYQNTRPSAAVVYLPQSATPAQNAALLDWLRKANRELRDIRLQTRAVPMQITHAGKTTIFDAGHAIHFQAHPFTPCGLISCGESLWYTPRSQMNSYTVGVTSESVVREPLLALTWIDHGKNNVFEGRFGEGTTSQAAFVAPALVCAVAHHSPHE
ncbi:MAG TPA: DUF1326 domain-containing protein [Verrucomicrobiae bacterium]|nr:DUF1326 domain-containing protein [Verrucomicrobiae bacterium]